MRRPPPSAILILVLFALGSAAALGFLILGSEVLEGETYAFDRWLLAAPRDPQNLATMRGPQWLEVTMRDLTALGGIPVLTLITASAAGFLLLMKKRSEALFLVVSIGVGLMLSNELKRSYGRARPDFIPHGTEVSTLSFPSGHAMMSAIVYLTLGALLARTQSDVRIKVYIVALSIFMTAIVGVSRIFLAVHWPTDVIAGWSIGAAWALLSWLVISRLSDGR